MSQIPLGASDLVLAGKSCYDCKHYIYLRGTRSYNNEYCIAFPNTRGSHNLWSLHPPSRFGTKKQYRVHTKRRQETNPMTKSIHLTNLKEITTIRFKCNKCCAVIEVPVNNFVKVDGGIFVRRKDFKVKKGLTIPEITVKVNDFYIDDFVVTQADWNGVMDYNPSYFRYDSLPVEMVGWHEAVLFCNKKSERDGLRQCYTIDGEQVECDFMDNPKGPPKSKMKVSRGNNWVNGESVSDLTRRVG